MHFIFNRRFMPILILCLIQQASWAQLKSVNTLTWTSTNGNSVPMLRVTLTDGKPRLFIVDTSLPLSVIDQDVAKEAGLVSSIANPSIPGQTIGYVKSPVHFGPDIFSLEGVPFRLADLMLLRQDDPNIAGIIGINVLSHFTLRMDYTKQQMDVIVDSVTATPNLPKDVTRIPLTKSGEIYSIEANIDGHTARFVINTATDRAYLRSPGLLKSLKPKATLDGFQSVAGTSTGQGLSVVETVLIRLHSLRFSGIRWDNPIFEQQTVPSKDTSNALGNDFLKRFRVVIDFPASTLYLTPDPAYKEDPEEWIGTGMNLSSRTHFVRI
jgi:hypothetical protein